MIKIQNMSLRLTGVSTENGRFIQNEVLRLLSEKETQPTSQRHIDNLNVKITLPTGINKYEQARIIANTIFSKINSDQNY